MNAGDELPLGAAHEAERRKVGTAGIAAQILRSAGALGMLAFAAALRAGGHTGHSPTGLRIHAARSG